MQSARCGIRTPAELAAGVELREDDLDARQARAGFDVDRDAATGVVHLDAGIGVQDDVDALAVAGQGFVDRVVDDLPDAVHETAGIGRADVHAGTLADRLEPLEHLKVMGGVLGGHNPQDYRRMPTLPCTDTGLWIRVRAERNVMPSRHSRNKRVVV